MEIGATGGLGGVPGPQEWAADSLPLMPGFREMALRRMSEERRRLVTGLTAQRQAAGLSQTEIAARMGTSQSAVARLEAGEADPRASTLERYAAAIGTQITWQVTPTDDPHPPEVSQRPQARRAEWVNNQQET